VEFGDYVQFGPRCVVQCNIRFGNHVLIAPDVAFVGRNDHRIDVVGKTIWDSPRGVAQVTTVEDDVWIWYGAIVLSGVTIGRGSVVAAGAVVASDVGRYSIVAGVPAREIGKRFSDDEIQLHEEMLGVQLKAFGPGLWIPPLQCDKNSGSGVATACDAAASGKLTSASKARQ